MYMYIMARKCNKRLFIFSVIDSHVSFIPGASRIRILASTEEILSGVHRRASGVEPDPEKIALRGLLHREVPAWNRKEAELSSFR